MRNQIGIEKPTIGYCSLSSILQCIYLGNLPEGSCRGVLFSIIPVTTTSLIENPQDRIGVYVSHISSKGSCISLKAFKRETLMQLSSAHESLRISSLP